MQHRIGVSMAIVALVGALATSSAIADEMFLAFDGEIVGDSTDAQHPGEINLLSYSLGITAATSWTKGGGASVAKPDPGDFQFTMGFNRSLPTIVKYITTGKAARIATLTLRSDSVGSKPGFEYARYTFEGVFFTSVGEGLAGPGRAVSAVSFVYKTLKLEVFAPGTSGPVSCVLWNIPEGGSGGC
jgi:type VI secretion system secreted protein Hcp